MSIKQFIRTRLFVKHTLIAIGITILLIIISLQILSLYTFHGDSQALPDFSGWTPQRVSEFCEENDLKFQVVDSVFVKDYQPGTIVDQSPDSGFHVKKHRTVYLTINAKEAEKIPMPNLVDLSLRQAKSTLDHRGLFLGQIDYKPDMAVGIVLKQSLDNEILPPGKLIPKGSTINLTVGSGLSDEQVQIPSLFGLTLARATEVVNFQYLTIGVVFYDEESILTKQDSLNAKIYKQSPEYDGVNMISLGSSLDIWLTTDELKLSGGTINNENFDSIEESENE